MTVLECGHPRDGHIRLIHGTIPVCDHAPCLAAAIERAGHGIVGEYRYGPAAA